MSQRKIKTPGRKKRATWPRYWITVGTLAAYTTFAGKTPQAGAQQTTATGRSTVAPNGGGAVLRFDIPPGPLGDVIGRFVAITKIRVQLSRDDLRTVWSKGVTGLYSPQRALEKVLEDTGLACYYTATDSVTIDIPAAATSVEVTASAPLASLTKFPEPVLDTPQSVTVVPQQVLLQQGDTTLRDALRNVAGISLAAGEGGAQGDNLTIRGFSARNDIFLDGMRDFGSYYRDPFVFDQVQVLEGPSSVAFGRGSTGGVVNQVLKSPSLDSQFRGTLNLGTDNTRRLTADWDRPVPTLGHGAAFRFNFMAHDSQVAERDVAESRRVGVAPSLSLGLGTPTTFKLGYLGEWADDSPDYGVPWYFDQPAPVSRQNYYGFRHGNFLKTRVNMGTGLLEHQFKANVRLRSQTRYAHYSRAARITEARIPTPPDVTPDTPLADISITRNQIAVASVEKFLENQTDVLLTLRTGAFRNDLVAGIEATRESSSPTRFNFTDVPTTNLLNPDTTQPFSGQSSVRTVVSGKATTVGGYVLDTVHMGRHVDLLGGVRFDRFDASYQQFFPQADPLDHVDVMASWRGAFVYKPVDNGSIYFSYGNSFNPSAESLSLSSANISLDPEENKTYEIGSKWQIPSGRLSLRIALFRTDKLNAREPDPNDPTLNVLAGKQRVNGIEGLMSTRITSRWQLQAGYSNLEAKVVSSAFYPLSIGARLANVPKNSFNFWSNYEFPCHLSVGGGGQYIDSRTASSTVPTDPYTHHVKQAPSYVVFNAMAAYPVSDHVGLQVNVYNLGNAYYYDQLHPAHVVPGPGRSVLAGVNFKF